MTQKTASATAGLAEAREPLRAADPVMRRIIDERPGSEPASVRRGPREVRNLFGALLGLIVRQQLAAGAADAILRRFTVLFGGRQPNPAEVLAADPEGLRSAGLSRAKVAAGRTTGNGPRSGRGGR